MDVRLPHEAHAPQPAAPGAGRPETSPDSPPRLVAADLRRWARGWRRPITDGPFAESMEMFGG